MTTSRPSRKWGALCSRKWRRELTICSATMLLGRRLIAWGLVSRAKRRGVDAVHRVARARGALEENAVRVLHGEILSR